MLDFDSSKVSPPEYTWGWAILDGRGGAIRRALCTRHETGLRQNGRLGFPIPHLDGIPCAECNWEASRDSGPWYGGRY